MTTEERNYAREIERYFFGLSGKGIMLSARDYGFIRELGRRSVSRETVIKGIAYGFRERERRGAGRPRDLFAIREEIELYIKSCLPEPRPSRPEGGTFAERKTVEGVVRNLDRVITEEKRESLKRKYKNLRGLVVRAGEKDSPNVYGKFASLWRAFLEDVFSDLPEEERKRITEAAESRLPAESKFYDEDTRRETLLAFREDILLETLEIRNVFTMN